MKLRGDKERVIRDLAKFCDEYYGDAGAVLSAHDSLLADRDHPLVVADLLGRLIQEGLLKIAAKPDGRGKPTLVEIVDSNPEVFNLFLDVSSVCEPPSV